MTDEAQAAARSVGEEATADFDARFDEHFEVNTAYMSDTADTTVTGASLWLTYWPPMVEGEVHWGDWRGRSRTYRGPVMDLGIGIPRHAPSHGIRRAVFDLAFGYVNGFPVRDIIAYVLRVSLWPSPIRDAIVTAEEA